MKILIIDDDEDTREVLSMILGSEGHRIEEAADGVEALERLRSGSMPSLILLDMMMPRLDGEGFMKARRRDARIAHVPVFIMSGHEAGPQKAQELGADGWLVKPVELDELTTAVHAIAAREN
jgi:two-component system, chemotaxis family, chemotaxis protein CheY